MKDIKCKTCFGCNLLEIKYFKGKYECNNYVNAYITESDMCKEILGEQLSFHGKEVRL